MNQSPLKFYVIAYASGHKGNLLAEKLLHKFPEEFDVMYYKPLGEETNTHEYIGHYLEDIYWKQDWLPVEKNSYFSLVMYHNFANEIIDEITTRFNDNSLFPRNNKWKIVLTHASYFTQLRAIRDQIAYSLTNTFKLDFNQTKKSVHITQVISNNVLNRAEYFKRHHLSSNGDGVFFNNLESYGIGPGGYSYFSEQDNICFDTDTIIETESIQDDSFYTLESIFKERIPPSMDVVHEWTKDVPYQEDPWVYTHIAYQLQSLGYKIPTDKLYSSRKDLFSICR